MADRLIVQAGLRLSLPATNSDEETMLVTDAAHVSRCIHHYHDSISRYFRRSTLGTPLKRKTPVFFFRTLVPITTNNNNQDTVLVVLSHRTKVFKNQSLDPPDVTKTPGLRFSVSFQKVEAYPGQDAALRPCSLMYQLEHPAAKTEPCS
jgi:hypothetical protein